MYTNLLYSSRVVVTINVPILQFDNVSLEVDLVYWMRNIIYYGVMWKDMHRCHATEYMKPMIAHNDHTT